MNSSQIVHQTLKDNGVFPNNEMLPLLVYRKALELPERDPAALLGDVFEQNHWPGAWRNGIFGFHHYHSTAHEVLGIYGGEAEVQFGGDDGITLTVCTGDVVIIPAGVAHKNLGSSREFGVVGAYPQGQRPDTCYGKPQERARADRNITTLALPLADPVYGADGIVQRYWLR